MNSTIEMISEIYEKVFYYYEEDNDEELFNDYSILRNFIVTGWIYDNYDMFVELWKKIRSKENMIKNMNDYGKTITRLVGDEEDHQMDYNDYDELQGSSNSLNSSYDSHSDNQIYNMRRKITDEMTIFEVDDKMSISELDEAMTISELDDEMVISESEPDCDK